MGFDGQTEAVGPEGVLALQVGADSVDVVLGECFHRERAVSGASLLTGGAEREVAGVRLDQGKCTLNLRFPHVFIWPRQADPGMLVRDVVAVP